MRTALKYLGLVIIFSACTNLQFRIPNPRVETPEIIAEAERNRWAMGYDIGGGNTIQPTSDASARPPDFTHPSSMAGFEPQGVGHFGFAQRFQLGLELQLDPDSPFYLTDMKYKILGDNREDDFLLTVSLRVGTGYAYKSGTQKGVFGPGGYGWNGTTRGTLTGTALSFGKYMQKDMLWYVGFAYDKVWTETSITQEPNTTAGDPGGSYLQNWVANNWTAGGGIQMKAGRRFLMDFGIYYYNTRLSGADGSNAGISGRMGGQWLFN